jgi:hypothetical protein
LHCTHHQLPDDPLLLVLAELSAAVVNGTKHTVDDFLQELKCNINIKDKLKFLSHLTMPMLYMVPTIRNLGYWPV